MVVLRVFVTGNHRFVNQLRDTQKVIKKICILKMKQKNNKKKFFFSGN